MSNRAIHSLLFGAIIVLGIFLRFYRIDSQSLWWDEGYSYGLAQDIQKQGIDAFSASNQGHAAALSSDKPQALYHILVSLLPSKWPPEWKMRFWPAITGSLSLFLLLGILKLQEIKSSQILITLLLAGISPFLIYYSQEGRPYSLLFMAELLFLYIVRLYPKQDSYKKCLVVTITIVFIGLIQFMGLIVPFSYALAQILVRRDLNTVKVWLVIGCLSTLLLLPIFYLIIIHKSAPLPTQGISISNYLYAFYVFIVGFSLGPSSYELHLDRTVNAIMSYWPLIVAVGLFAGFALLRGLHFVWKSKTSLDLLFVSALSLFMLSIAFLMHIIPLYPRHMMMLFPFFLLIIGSGLDSLAKPTLKLSAVLAIVLLMGWSDINFYNNEKYFKDDMRGAAALINDNEQKGDLVFVGVIAAFIPYYSGLNRIIRIPKDDQQFFSLYEKLKHDHRLWIVISRPWEFDSYMQKRDYLNGRSSRFDFRNVQIYLAGEK